MSPEFNYQVELSEDHKNLLVKNSEFLTLINPQIEGVNLEVSRGFMDVLVLKVRVAIHDLGVLLYRDEGPEFEDLVQKLFYKAREQLNYLMDIGTAGKYIL